MGKLGRYPPYFLRTPRGGTDSFGRGGWLFLFLLLLFLCFSACLINVFSAAYLLGFPKQLGRGAAGATSRARRARMKGRGVFFVMSLVFVV